MGSESRFRVETIVSGLSWGEGPVWSEQLDGVLFSDIPANRILLWRANRHVTVFDGNSDFANGMTTDADGRIIACEHRTRRVTRREADGTRTVLADSFEGKPLNSPNDVVVASDGAVWFTDPCYGILQGHCPEGSTVEQAVDGVYRIDPETGHIHRMIDCLDKPNGLCFSPDGTTLYVSDTGYSERPDGNHHIFRFDVRIDADPMRPVRVFAEISPGGPDGIRMSEDGLLWTTAGDGIRALDHSGSVLVKIPLGELTTNLCFLTQSDPHTCIFVTTPTRALIVHHTR